jgi:hypothetical protein
MRVKLTKVTMTESRIEGFATEESALRALAECKADPFVVFACIHESDLMTHLHRNLDDLDVS